MRLARRPLLQALGLTLIGCGQRAPISPPAPAAAGRTVLDAVRLPGTRALSAIAIEGGRITQIAERGALAGRRIDGGGGLVLPGFHDAHVHLRSGGLMLGQAQLADLDTMEAVQAAVKAYAAAHPGHAWVVGRGWSYDIVAEGSFPTRHQLDAVVADRPVYLESYDGHAGWVNSEALRQARIDASVVDPPDGRIVRDADGSPQGTLLEGAMALLERQLPLLSPAEEEAALARALAHLRALGVTSVDDFASDEATFARYAKLEKGGRLPLRVALSLPLDGPITAYHELRRQHDDDWLRFGYLKGFVDGVIESKTAFMLARYAGSDTAGEPLIEPARLRQLVSRAHDNDFRVALHAIGDAAVRLSLDCIAYAGKRGGPGHSRIEHIEVVHRDDLPRFAQLGVFASMQPYHAVPSDVPDTGVWSDNLGPERLARSFAWRELADAGATLAFGSDWPVMSADPLWGIAVATTRQNRRALPADGWHAEQALRAGEAIDAYSVAPARALGIRDLGAIAPGMLADLVVLDSAVSLDDPATLWDGPRISRVIVGGR